MTYDQDIDIRTQAVGQQAVPRLHAELQAESDRGAVLVAGSMLDVALQQLLVAYFADSGTPDPLFEGANAPLHSLSAKIDLASRLGFISDGLARDLHVIRRIRNDFAHRPS